MTSMTPTATAAEYEAAISEMENCFKRNKSRMWVLRCIRDRLPSAAPTSQQPDDATKILRAFVKKAEILGSDGVFHKELTAARTYLATKGR